MAQFNLCFRVAFLAVLLPLTSGACVYFCLGMGSGTIPDSNINASSVQSASTPAKNGRLNYTSGSSWCAGTSDTNPYLQIDLQTLHIICAVSTQGNSQADQWVKTYTLQLSMDGTTWTDYKEGGQVKVLEGNKDINSNVKHVLYGVLTRYLRFLPQTHQGEVCMRTEVFGVPQKPTCDSQAIGLASGGRILDDSFSATSIYSSMYKAKYGRLNGTRAWAPETNGRDDYLQIDLLYEYVICAVATQGNPPTQSPAQEWITEYKLRFSFNGTTFFPYKENKTDKAFPGNSGKTDTVKNSLTEFASAKFIRFLPTKYNRFKVLRVEAYGILFTKVPSQPPTAFQLTSNSSTRITASWQLPPVFARHRDITGFKLFYKKKGSGGSATTLYISDGRTLSRTVSGLDKFTEYEFQVLAYTSDGDGPKSSAKVKRTMEDAPSQPPSNFSVTPTSSTGVTASWQLPPVSSRNGLIKGFKLFYKRKESSGSGTILPINSESTLNKNVNGLYKYTEYEFQVLAFTFAGDGVNSSAVVQRTKEDVPSQPPNGFTLAATTSESITVSWRLPPEDSRNGIIKGYKLFFKKKGSSGAGSMQLISSQAIHTKEVAGLDKYTEYEFQVLAFTSVGDGPNSTTIFKKTKEAAPSQPPSQFTVFVNSSTSITASWQLPPVGFRHGIIKGYKLFYRKKDSSCATILTLGKGNISARVTKLDEYTEYEFQVLAFTSAGDGPNSSTVFKTTMEDAPSVPLSLSSVDMPPSKSHGPRITLTWSEPAEPNGVIRSYTLFYSHDGVAPKEISGIGRDALNHTVDVLGGVTYQFNVRAVTIKPGPNATKTVTTKEYAPSQPPSQFSVFVNSSTSITASWQLPPVGSRHGIVKGYKMFYKKKGSGFATTLTLDKGNTSRRFTKLDEYTEYEFQVLAFTSAGDGPNSSSVFRTTMEDAPSAPISLSSVDVPPSNLHGPRITLTWSEPAESNGVIRSYTLFYSHDGVAPREISGIGKDALNHTLDVLGGVTYRFDVRAVTIKPGPNRTITVMSREYEPSRGPEGISSSAVNSRKINITWLRLSREVAYGTIINYEVRLSVEENCTEIQSSYPSTINTTATYILVTGLSLCAKYAVSVRGYTAVGPGPYSRSVMEQIFRNPVIKDLPKRTVVALNELVVLTCEVNGDSEVSVTWTKDGLTSIPRAQFKNSGKILVIQNVVPGDSGVYECIAMNRFGESRTASTLIVAVPPSIIKEVSPSSVMCEKQTLCLVSCQATSYIPFNYSWTKDGQVPTGDGIKLMKNSIVVTPRDAQDYGQYVCHASNSFGSTKYQITLLAPKDTQCNDGTQSILLAIVIALSCLVVVSLIMNGVFIWQRRRAVKSSPDQQSSDQQASVPSLYMELKPRPTNQQSHVPTEYQSLQEKPGNPGYCNVVFQRENNGKQNDEIYEEI